MAILGWKVARRIEFFWSKSLKTEYAIKSRDLLRFDSNFDITLILIVKNVQKVRFQKFSFFDPQRRNPDFPDFEPKFRDREFKMVL